MGAKSIKINDEETVLCEENILDEARGAVVFLRERGLERSVKGLAEAGLRRELTMYALKYNNGEPFPKQERLRRSRS